MDNLLTLIFPPKCIICGNYGSLFCSGCLSSCRKLRRNYTLKLKKPHPSLDVFCYFVYERSIRECIKQSKYSRKQFAVLKEVSKVVIEDMLRRGIGFKVDYILPIPLSLAKKRYRGFNQAEVIAQVVSKAYAIPNQNSILIRQKNTTAQHRLNKQERLENMRGAFGVIPNVTGKTFLLVDDICTTGATLTEAAQTLYRAGAKKVEAFTLSKRL